MLKTTTFALFTALILLLSACQSGVSTKPKGPENAPKPKAEIKQEIKKSNRWVHSKGASFKIEQSWWQAMGDKELNQLIENAVNDNLDLKIMLNRVQLAGVAIKEAEINKDPRFGFEAGSQSSINNNNLNTNTQFSTAATAGWELDIWGKIKNLNQSSVLEYKATEADWQAAYLNLIKQISDAYFILRQLDEQKSLHLEAIAYSQKLYKIYDSRVKNQIEDSTNRSREKAEILRLESELLDIKRQRILQENQISILSGKAPGELKLAEKKLRDAVKPITFPKDISVNLLERRPDIIAAELRVQRDYQQEEFTRAARLPSVTLGLTQSFASDSISTLTSGWTAAFIPKISFPALDPQSKLNIDKAGINLEITQTQYKDTVIKAIADVEKALINRQTNDKRMIIEKERLKEIEDIHKKVVARKDQGVISGLELIQSQQQVLASRQLILKMYSQLMQDTVGIYTALGGGWKVQ